MKITFKNVGQGDSIMLQWATQKEGLYNRLGIIDCNRYNGRNPVVEHVDRLKPQKIDFIVLSHPHMDHYSGMLDLLLYCEQADIRIDRFVLSGVEHPINIGLYEYTDKQCELYAKIVMAGARLHQSGLINSLTWPVADSSLDINDEFRLKCMSPSRVESTSFLNQVRMFDREKNKPRARQAANLLATIFVLQSAKAAFIFTSDASFETFERFRDRHMHEFFGLKLCMCQIPHHGSRENHQMAFWKAFEYEINCPAIVSAGEHMSFRHPHIEVIRDFDDNRFKIHATNFVNGVAAFMNERMRKRGRKLDSISDPVAPRELKGDQTFKLTTDGSIYLPDD